MIEAVKIGNIFESECKTIVNTVNCVGVMGKGIALEFKNKYPAMNQRWNLAAPPGIESLSADYIICFLWGLILWHMEGNGIRRLFAEVRCGDR